MNAYDRMWMERAKRRYRRLGDAAMRWGMHTRRGRLAWELCSLFMRADHVLWVRFGR